MMGVSSFVGAPESPRVEQDRDRRGRDWMGHVGVTGPGGGGTDSLSLSTNCETTAPLFGQRTAPVLLPSNLQPPLFKDNTSQPLEISIKW